MLSKEKAPCGREQLKTVQCFKKIFFLNVKNDFVLGQLIVIKERLAYMPCREVLPKLEQHGGEISF